MADHESKKMDVTGTILKKGTRQAQGGRGERDSTANDLIGQKLRAYYDEMAKQPVPDRFSALLRELEEKTKKDGKG